MRRKLFIFGTVLIFKQCLIFACLLTTIGIEDISPRIR